MNDTIELSGFEFDTIIGILDSEQRATQRIAVNIKMELPLGASASSGTLDTSINYADVQAWTMTIAQQGKWRLLESLVHAVARLLLAEPASCEGRAQIHAVEIEIRKLQILNDAVPGVRIRREREWCDLQESEVSPGVQLGTLEATPVQGAWRVRLEPDTSWVVPASQSLQVVGGSGTVVERGRGQWAISHGNVVARAPGRTITAGPAGLCVIAVGEPG